ncbi:MAG: DnaA N-terminal domain-containing protein, partial [bacterium]|nr:DnaA N-terminal domain-containing protein [bacterium]
MTFEQMWQSVLGEIELQVSRENFITWFKNTGILEKKEGAITVYVPNNFSKEWLENKYNKYVLRALRNLNSDIKEVNYIIRNAAEPLVSMSNAKKDKINRAVFEE